MNNLEQLEIEAKKPFIKLISALLDTSCEIKDILQKVQLEIHKQTEIAKIKK